jgi:NSS family neurotransmitter:Na+ symporter
VRGSWLQAYINFAISYVCPLILGIIATVTILDRFFGVSLLG